MQRMCAKCGAIFETSGNEKYCSTKCEKGGQGSLLGYLKR